MLIAREAAEGQVAEGHRRGRGGGRRRGATLRSARARAAPGRLVAEARRRGFELDADAARSWSSASASPRPGCTPSSTAWLSGPREGAASPRRPRGNGRRYVRGGRLGALRRAWWTATGLRRPAPAADRLTAQGESVTPLIYQAAKRLREAAWRRRPRGGALGEGARGLAPDASLRREAAGAPRGQHQPGALRRRAAPSLTSNGGPAAAPTTRTTSRWRLRCAASGARRVRRAGRVG